MVDNDCVHYEVCSYSGFAFETCEKCKFRKHVVSHTNDQAVENVVGVCIEHPWAEEENGLLISEYECPFCHAWHRESAIDIYCTSCGKSIKIVQNKR